MSERHDRSYYVRLILASSSRKKVIVSGPGTGKTYTFERALKAAGGRGLAMTFINNLVDELRGSLQPFADAFTFHHFCKRLLHKFGARGLSSDFDLYPSIANIFAEDLTLLLKKSVSKSLVDTSIDTLDDRGGVITSVFRLQNYYNAVGHSDLVCRTYFRLKENPELIPSYPLIVIDEYQDFNLLETEFIKLLDKNPLLIVGDDDQALYSFKHASPKFIREVAADPAYTRFELPFCSRCPKAIVDSVNDVIAASTSLSLLQGRVPKTFSYCPEEKRRDSERYPKIIYANCTVSSYMARYVIDEIKKISVEDIAESRQKGYYTVLIIGSRQFLSPLYEDLVGVFPQAKLKRSEESRIHLLDGYRRLAENEESWLGWRIVSYCDHTKRIKATVEQALAQGKNLAQLQPSRFKSKHLQLSRLVRQLLDGNSLSPFDQKRLEEALGCNIDEIMHQLNITGEARDESEMDLPTEGPSILCTTWLGAKGLSGGHIFLVGMNNGHLPGNPKSIKDNEVCNFIVGLSRSRKRCHVISCNHFATGWLKPSVFIYWIKGQLNEVHVDKSSFR
jgi:superfamily I DNA/RNA helicase